jgi:hypothetical protein
VALLETLNILFSLLGCLIYVGTRTSPNSTTENGNENMKGKFKKKQQHLKMG